MAIQPGLLAPEAGEVGQRVPGLPPSTIWPAIDNDEGIPPVLPVVREAILALEAGEIAVWLPSSASLNEGVLAPEAGDVGQWVPGTPPSSLWLAIDVDGGASLRGEIWEAIDKLDEPLLGLRISPTIWQGVLAPGAGLLGTILPPPVVPHQGILEADSTLLGAIIAGPIPSAEHVGILAPETGEVAERIGSPSPSALYEAIDVEAEPANAPIPPNLTHQAILAPEAGELASIVVDTPAELQAACIKALNRLIEVFKRDRIETWICIFTAQFQALEDEITHTLEMRPLPFAVGFTLDRWGELYGETRNGEVDGVFRARIQAAALGVASRGFPDELIGILQAFDQSFAPLSLRFIEHYPAAFIMTLVVPVGMRERALDAARIIRRSKPAGVQFVLMFEQRSDLFSWSGYPGEGWQDLNDPVNTGGVWSEASDGRST